MPRKAMVITVLQATALWVLAYVIRHHALEHAWSPLENFQDAYRANRTAGLQIDGDRNDTQTLLLNATLNSSLNSTSNSTSSGAEGSASDEEAFYTKDVPKYIFKTLAIAILRYYWLIYLERLLPARPRVSAAAPAEKEDDESREEEVIRKWVESGRVRRASLNWCNTFGKWMLDLTVGNLWQTFLWLAMGTMMRAEWPWKGDAFDKLVSARNLPRCHLRCDRSLTLAAGALRQLGHRLLRPRTHRHPRGLHPRAGAQTHPL